MDLAFQGQGQGQGGGLALDQASARQSLGVIVPVFHVLVRVRRLGRIFLLLLRLKLAHVTVGVLAAHLTVVIDL